MDPVVAFHTRLEEGVTYRDLHDVIIHTIYSRGMQFFLH